MIDPSGPTDYVDRRKARFETIFRSFLGSSRLCPAESTVLAVGASGADLRLLERLAFADIVVSNITHGGDGEGFGGTRRVVLDAEDLGIRQDGFDVVFAYEVLHHCRSPHGALGEMLRAARRYVVFVEPNDSALLRLLTNLRLSYPYELPAVIANRGASGGVRNSAIPNYIYRWKAREVDKTVASLIPEYEFRVFSRGYWDFTITEEELRLRTSTLIPMLVSTFGASTLTSTLGIAQRVLNGVPALREQGNKFACIIEKSTELKPWLRREGEDLVFQDPDGR